MKTKKMPWEEITGPLGPPQGPAAPQPTDAPQPKPENNKVKNGWLYTVHTRSDADSR